LAKVKITVIGSLQLDNTAAEGTVNVEDVSEIIRQIELKYPQDQYFNFNIFLNGISISDKSKKLLEGDEVVIIPIMSGG
jgi:molybdopterin converting factor small subunit